MTDGQPPPERLAEVSRLANQLAERVLSDHMAERPIPDGHIHALAKASQLLAEYGQEVPSLLAPIMDQIRARTAGEGEARERADGTQDEQ
ncbi:conserved hypothetical protein [Methylobacterium sp. 4-46]|uniref:hypothetical protein n=1 Tax=unclassified Methylobacterium TaxID=2615210 RepID=UPI000152D76B|nr:MULTISPECIES: hypothetical protein [Methylobacterium]ACA17748.1 conserved hypothetical protein [Methylobacterium sp. 4-46]WFT83416.1 hypothetical protein QA634_16960 [Methylobacterium nodulans]